MRRATSRKVVDSVSAGRRTGRSQAVGSRNRSTLRELDGEVTAADYVSRSRNGNVTTVRTNAVDLRRRWVRTSLSNLCVEVGVVNSV